MNALPFPRWAVSFADLVLLLLAFFVLLHAGSAREVAAGARAAFSDARVAGPLLDAPAAALFEPGEARLRAGVRARLEGIGRAAAAGRRRLVVDSLGTDAAGRRYDNWELAAARAAAVARALGEGGLADDRISILLDADRVRSKHHRLTVRHGA